MFIAHVLSSFDLGGQERVALGLARAQRAQGDEVLVVSIAPLPEGPIGRELRDAGVRAETLAKRSNFDPSLPPRLAVLLARQGAEIVHTHNPQALIYGALAGRLAGARVVHTKHGINPDRARRVWLRRAAARLVDAYVVVTPSLARIAIHECDPNRVHVIANGIDTSSFTPRPGARTDSRRELGLPEDAWVVGTVGRLAPEKDQALLVKAMAPLLGERRRLVIVGDGPERDALFAVVQAANAERFVRLTGARSDVARLLSAFDAFALPSRSEGLPLVLLEAMASGLPVVATSVGGIPDLVVSGVTGLLVPPSDIPALRAALLSLAESPTLAHDLGGAAQQRVLALHSVDAMAKAYGRLYQAARRRAGRASVLAPAQHERLHMSGLALVAVFLLAYTYAGYPLLMATWAFLFPYRLRKIDEFEPTIGICIAVFNGAPWLEAKLRSLQRLEYPPDKIEVLVCSDGSTDDTARIVERLAASDPRIVLLENSTRLGKPASLNRLRRAARADVLLMTDVRQTFVPTTLRALIRPLADPSVGCVAGRLVLAGKTGAGAYWHYERFIRTCEGRIGSMVGVSGSIYALWRRDLPDLPEDLILDDMFVPLRIALSKRYVVFCEEAEAHDDALDDQREFARKVRTLAGNYQLLAKMPSLLIPGTRVWFHIMSHKILRLVCPFALLVLFGTSLGIALAPLPEVSLPELHFWRTLAFAQAVLYALALFGGRAGRVAGLMRTFVVLNAAAVVGLWRFLRKTQAVTW